MSLQPLVPNVWVAGAPMSFLGWHLGTRMAVVRLQDGTVLIHSPVPLDAALKQEIDAIGPVTHIVAPSLYHHTFAGLAVAAYPNAKLHGAPGLEKKRSDLNFHAQLGDVADPAWKDDLDVVPLQGCALGETVFFHKPSRTVISADLIENFKTSDHWWTRLYLKGSGIHGTIGLSRMLRPMFRDRKKARRSIDRILEWDADRVSLAHGDPILENGREEIRQTYAWLKA